MEKDTNTPDHGRPRRSFGKLCKAPRRFGAAGAVAATLLAMASATPTRAQLVTDPARSEVTIYHIEMRRSFRVIWLCEELGIPYRLVFKPGDIAGSLMLIKKANPLVGAAPMIEFRGQQIVESGAIIELLLAHYGKGRLVPPINSPDYAWYLQFLHYAEGSAAARMGVTSAVARALKVKPEDVPNAYPVLVNPEGIFTYMEQFLTDHPYFGGQNFTAADIMMHFVVRMSGMAGIDPDKYPHITAWRKKMQQRPAFKRALDVSLPGPQGHDEDGTGYGLPIPFSDPPAVYERPSPVKK